MARIYRAGSKYLSKKTARDIKKKMKEQGLFFAGIAKDLGLCAVTISSYLTGRTQSSRIEDYFRKFCFDNGIEFKTQN
jgi:predicted transcriptional regulator